MANKNITYPDVRKKSIVDVDPYSKSATSDVLGAINSVDKLKSRVEFGNLNVANELDAFFSGGNGGWCWAYEYIHGASNEVGALEVVIPPVMAHHLVVHKISGGRVRLRFNDREEVRVIENDELQIIPALHSLRIETLSDGPFHTLHFIISQAFLDLLLRASNRIFDPRMQLQACFGKSDIVLANLLTAIITCEKKYRLEMLVPMGSALVTYLLGEYGHVSCQNNLAILTHEQIQVARKVMVGQLGAGLDLDEVSAALHMTSSYFSRALKNTTGQTPFQFFHILRMESARSLVENSLVNLTNIAMDLGFFDASHFSKSFHKYWKILPSQLRRRHVPRAMLKGGLFYEPDTVE